MSQGWRPRYGPVDMDKVLIKWDEESRAARGGIKRIRHEMPRWVKVCVEVEVEEMD